MAEIDWVKYRDIVLNLLRAKYERMAESQRSLPYIVFQDPKTMETITLSPNDAIREVNNLSELGKKLITAELIKMGELQP